MASSSQLEREGKTWRLESELVSRSRAKRPRDAIRHVRRRDRRARCQRRAQRADAAPPRWPAKQVEGFISGIGKHANGPIDEFGTDRAELRWDENGIRYRIVLRKEDDEWRVDDIYIRPSPKEDDSDKGSLEPQAPED